MLRPAGVRPQFHFGVTFLLIFLHPGFEHVRNWLADVREHADPHVSCILVGNKIDLCEDTTPPAASGTAPTPLNPPKVSTIKGNKSSPSKAAAAKLKAREVPYEEAERWAKEEGLLFVEASAKSGLNVEQAFVDASRNILEKIKQGVFDDDRASIFVLPGQSVSNR